MTKEENFSLFVLFFFVQRGIFFTLEGKKIYYLGGGLRPNIGRRFDRSRALHSKMYKNDS